MVLGGCTCGAIFMKRIISLSAPPEYGIHLAIFKAAVTLRDAGASGASALSALFAWRGPYAFRRPVSDTELREACLSAFNRPSPRMQRAALQHHVGSTKPTWPIADPDKRAQLVEPDFGLVDLWERSPIRFDDAKAYTRWVLPQLFPRDPLLCFGETMSRFETRRLSEWQEPEKMQFIVPSTMTATEGRRKADGLLSAHTLENTGPRRFLVVDFDDDAGLDVHAATAWFLGSKLPLVLALYSGGKGLHAWFSVEGRADCDLLPVFQLACELGGDRALWTRSQFARMPDGLRNNGKRQRIFYFNPEVLN
jgi:hypothetical protein